MNKITSRTRAPRKGKFIYCPHCGAQARVYHFDWSALGCQQCDAMVDQTEWFLDDPNIKHNRGFMVLLNDRSWDDSIYKFNEELAKNYGYILDWVESSGSRSIHVFKRFKAKDPEERLDLPHWAFEEFHLWFKRRHGKTPAEAGVKFLQRIEDPGLGIMLPEDWEFQKQVNDET